MHTRRYIFIQILAVVTLCVGYFFFSKTPVLPLRTPVIIAAEHGFSISFDSRALHAIWEYPEDAFTLNGSYFGKTKTGTYFPAGLFLSGWIEFSPLDLTDPNLSYVIEYTNTWSLMRLVRASEYSQISRSGYNALQAGPLLVDHGKKIVDFGGSWHAFEPHERTVLCSVEEGMNYFLLFPEPITLPVVEDFILTRSEFHDRTVTCINLDGGPSTAFSVHRISKWLDFRPDIKLPILIHVK